MINSVGLTYGLDARTIELSARTIRWLGDWLDIVFRRLKFDDPRERF